MVNDEKKVKNLVGKVVSDKMDKTITVKVDRVFRDERFHKTVCVSKKYKVHDEHQVASAGDVVSFHVGRRLSKEKYMYLDKILKARSASLSE
jgi:small subunit ribosomal protein S17